MALSLSIGANCPPISAQLDEQDVRYDDAEAEQWDKWGCAIASMSIRGIVTDSERQRITKRLRKLIRARLAHHARRLHVEASVGQGSR